MTDQQSLTAEPAPGPTDGEARAALQAVRAEVAKAVVGQDAAVTGLVIALLARGHVLLEGVPGVAKTLLVRAMSAALDLQTTRVQFTPDLMPGDVTGSLVYDARTAEFSFREGPVFTNLLLADEINRTPPKTQASLLEAMQERQVSVDGRPRPLPDPFVVCATQNPVEYEGTYPLPEAQLDRFLLKLTMPLPPREDEVQVLQRHAVGLRPQRPRGGRRPPGGRCATTSRPAPPRCAALHVAPEVLGYVVDLARATRTSPSLSLGVSPRGATALLATSRAWAWLGGRDYVSPDDVKALASCHAAPPRLAAPRGRARGRHGRLRARRRAGVRAGAALTAVVVTGRAALLAALGVAVGRARAARLGRRAGVAGASSSRPSRPTSRWPPARAGWP